MSTKLTNTWPHAFFDPFIMCNRAPIVYIHPSNNSMWPKCFLTLYQRHVTYYLDTVKYGGTQTLYGYCFIPAMCIGKMLSPILQLFQGWSSIWCRWDAWWQLPPHNTGYWTLSLAEQLLVLLSHARPYAWWSYSSIWKPQQDWSKACEGYLKEITVLLVRPAKKIK